MRKQWFGVLLVAVAALAVAAEDKKEDAVKADLKKLQGTWQLVSGENNGEKMPDEAVKAMKAVVKDDTVTIHVGDKAAGAAKLTIDPTKKPKTMDSTATMGPDKGKTSFAIYEIDGDKIKICFCDKERPKEFTGKKGSNCMLVEYKREK